MLHCKFSGDYNRERIFKIGQYLTKLCVEHLGFTFLDHPVCYTVRFILLVIAHLADIIIARDQSVVLWLAVVRSPLLIII